MIAGLRFDFPRCAPRLAPLSVSRRRCLLRSVVMTFAACMTRLATGMSWLAGVAWLAAGLLLLLARLTFALPAAAAPPRTLLARCGSVVGGFRHRREIDF